MKWACLAVMLLIGCAWSGQVFGQTGPWFAWDVGLAGYARLPLRTGNVPSPPYFALHPPVYYRQIHPRDYGQSPFAHWPCCCRDLSSMPNQSRVVRRDSNSVPQTSVDVQRFEAAYGHAARSLLIVNPYYQPAMATSERFGGK